jgi:hypothetical protein
MFRDHVACAPGHAHLYGELDGIVARLAGFRSDGGALTAHLAAGILVTVDLLLQENAVGRRPWPGERETYFARCMEGANRLLKEVALFADFATFCPAGYCNRFLGSFAQMDRYAQETREHGPH